MKQESIHHSQHTSYPRDPQIRAYHYGDEESESQDAEPIEGFGRGDSVRDWQNPSRFRRDGTC